MQAVFGDEIAAADQHEVFAGGVFEHHFVALDNAAALRFGGGQFEGEEQYQADRRADENYRVCGVPRGHFRGKSAADILRAGNAYTLNEVEDIDEKRGSGKKRGRYKIHGSRKHCRSAEREHDRKEQDDVIIGENVGRERAHPEQHDAGDEAFARQAVSEVSADEQEN